ncbi:MAG: prepilin-type N-terminal cleavage/methylation domain-containing protein [Nitrospirae bacterium]|nr:prepilin-type N-terminal cleavage/methylation domain-containing protein [Nitrospirota bacterium]
MPTGAQSPEADPVIQYAHRPESGFTLLELIIVLFLAALILGISTVFFVNTLASGSFNETVRDLNSSMRHAQALARIENAGKSVFIDLDSRTFGIEGRASRRFSPDINIKITDPYSETIVHGRYSFRFSPSGGSDGGEITVSNKKKTAYITVDPVVGSSVVRQ